MSDTTKTPIENVLPIAEHIVDVLTPFCERIEIAGSLRRQRPMIGDVEIVAIPRLEADLLGQPINGVDEQRRRKETPLDFFLQRTGVQFIKNGPLMKQFIYGRFKVDLFLPASPAHWGAVFTIRTGSRAFSQWMVDYPARVAGVQFREGLVYRRMTSEIVPTPEEADVFRAVNIPYIPPDARNDYKWLEFPYGAGVNYESN